MKGSQKPYARRSDTELLKAARADPAAFEALFDRHAAAMLRWLQSQTGQESVAQDLLAEAFAVAWRGRSRFRGREERSGGAWLYGIARNLVLAWRRDGRVERAARERLGIATAAEDDGEIEALTRQFEAEGMGDAVRAAFLTLTPDQRRAVGFRVVAELSYADIAARLGCNPVTARTRVLRGLRAMRTLVAGEERR